MDKSGRLGVLLIIVGLTSIPLSFYGLHVLESRAIRVVVFIPEDEEFNVEWRGAHHSGWIPGFGLVLITGLGEYYLTKPIRVYGEHDEVFILDKGVTMSSTSLLKVLPVITVVILILLSGVLGLTLHILGKWTEKMESRMRILLELFPLAFIAAIVAIPVVPCWIDLKPGDKAILRINSYYRGTHDEIIVSDGVLMGKIRIILSTLLDIEIFLIIALLGTLITLAGVALIYKKDQPKNMKIKDVRELPPVKSSLKRFKILPSLFICLISSF